MTAAATKPRRKQGGVTTSDLVFSASRLPDAEALPDILALHAPPASPLLYVGDRGPELLKRVDPLHPLSTADLFDLEDGGSLRAVDDTLGALILDPPRASAPPADADEPPHDHTLRLYDAAGREALRALLRGGVLVAKCRDEVVGGRLLLTHVAVINSLTRAGLYAKDIHLMLEPGDPAPRPPSPPQIVAHINHSYYLVFKKKR